MAKDIAKIARERRKRARDMEYPDRIKLIIQYLGNDNMMKMEGSAHYFTDNLHMEYIWEGDAGWSHGEAYAWGNDWYNINYKEKRVYRNVNGRISKYIPGRWEGEFNELYVKAQQKRKRIQNKRKKEKEEKKRKNKKEYQRRLKRDFGIED